MHVHPTQIIGTRHKPTGVPHTAIRRQAQTHSIGISHTHHTIATHTQGTPTTHKSLDMIQSPKKTTHIALRSHSHHVTCALTPEDNHTQRTTRSHIIGTRKQTPRDNHTTRRNLTISPSRQAHDDRAQLTGKRHHIT